MSEPVAYANPGLLHELLALAERQLEERQRQGNATALSTRHAVRQLLFALQGETFPSLEAVADALHCSVRSLQRRLKSEGSSFRMELEAVQDARARSLLHKRQYSVAEVAWLCGYRDAASLTRAFRRRHGTTPVAYREEQEQQNPSVSSSAQTP